MDHDTANLAPAPARARDPHQAAIILGLLTAFIGLVWFAKGLDPLDQLAIVGTYLADNLTALGLR